MKTVDKVREELADIRHYYSNAKNFERVETILGKPSALKMVERYNRHIKEAPIKLFDLYACLYIDNNSQETVSIDWGCSVGYIKVLNRKLYEFFVEKFNKEDVTNVL